MIGEPASMERREIGLPPWWDPSSWGRPMRKTTLVVRMTRKWVHRRVHNSSRKEPGVGGIGRSGLDIPMCMKCMERRRPAGGDRRSGRGQGGLIGSQVMHCHNYRRSFHNNSYIGRKWLQHRCSQVMHHHRSWRYINFRISISCRGNSHTRRNNRSIYSRCNPTNSNTHLSSIQDR